MNYGGIYAYIAWRDKVELFYIWCGAPYCQNEKGSVMRMGTCMTCLCALKMWL